MKIQYFKSRIEADEYLPKAAVCAEIGVDMGRRVK